VELRRTLPKGLMPFTTSKWDENHMFLSANPRFARCCD